jgi:hypothetical protein
MDEIETMTDVDKQIKHSIETLKRSPAGDQALQDMLALLANGGSSLDQKDRMQGGRRPMSGSSATCWAFCHTSKWRSAPRAP